MSLFHAAHSWDDRQRRRSESLSHLLVSLQWFQGFIVRVPLSSSLCSYPERNLIRLPFESTRIELNRIACSDGGREFLAANEKTPSRNIWGVWAKIENCRGKHRRRKQGEGARYRIFDDKFFVGSSGQLR